MSELASSFQEVWPNTMAVKAQLLYYYWSYTSQQSSVDCTFMGTYRENIQTTVLAITRLLLPSPLYLQSRVNVAILVTSERFPAARNVKPFIVFNHMIPSSFNSSIQYY